MRKTIARTLAVGAFLALPLAGATMADAHTVPAKPVAAKAAAAKPATGIKAITGDFARQLGADDMTVPDGLRVNADGSVRLGGQPDNAYDCYGVVNSTAAYKYVLHLHCTSGGAMNAKAVYSTKYKKLTIQMERGAEIFHR